MQAAHLHPPVATPMPTSVVGFFVPTRLIVTYGCQGAENRRCLKLVSVWRRGLVRRRCVMQIWMALRDLPLEGVAIIAGLFALVTYAGWIAGRS